MVAIFVVATIIVFFVIDYFVQRAEKRKLATTPAAQTSKARFIIPKEYFFGKGHVWLELLTRGSVPSRPVGVHPEQGSILTRVGIDDFVQKIVGRIDEVAFVPVNQAVAKGDKLFTIRQGEKAMSFLSPISGKIISFNDELTHSPDILRKKPYSDGWIAVIEPYNPDEIKFLSKGTDAAQWLKDEIKRFRNFITGQTGNVSAAMPALTGATMMDGGIPVEDVMERSSKDTWQKFESDFLRN